MGIRVASFSSALTQILSPHGPLLNSTTCRTLGGTATATLQIPPALPNKINKYMNAATTRCRPLKHVKDYFFVCLFYFDKNNNNMSKQLREGT